MKNDNKNELNTNNTDKKERNVFTATQKKQNKLKRKRNKAIIWTIKITLITLILAITFSLLADFVGVIHYSISIALLILMVIISLISDLIGIAATACNPEPILAMASRKEPFSKQALLIVKNSEIVSNICCDVIGDICGIISGSLLVSVVFMLTSSSDDNIKSLFYILLSGVIASIMVGGKSLFKTLALNKSKEIVFATAKFLAIFYRPQNRNKK